MYNKHVGSLKPYFSSAITSIYHYFFCFSEREGIKNMMSLAEGKMVPMVYVSSLISAVLAKEGMEYFFYISIVTVI